jgi:large subunit ribosomal protein L23
MNKEQMCSIVRRPLITEKANDNKETFGHFAFEVDLSANKTEIRAAVEGLFNVRVMDVRTSIVRGKVKRMGRNVGKRPNWKKAVVTLQQGHEIDFFEGV